MPVRSPIPSALVVLKGTRVDLVDDAILPP